MNLGIQRILSCHIGPTRLCSNPQNSSDMRIWTNTHILTNTPHLQLPVPEMKWRSSLFSWKWSYNKWHEANYWSKDIFSNILVKCQRTGICFCSGLSGFDVKCSLVTLITVVLPLANVKLSLLPEVYLVYYCFEYYRPSPPSLLAYI